MTSTYVTYCLYGPQTDKVHQTLYAGQDAGKAFRAGYVNQLPDEANLKSFVQEWQDGQLKAEYKCIE